MSGLKLTDVIQTVRWGARDSIVTDDVSARPQTDPSRNAAPPDTGNVTRIDKLKQAFLTDLPVFMEGKSIAQSMASLDEATIVLNKPAAAAGGSSRDLSAACNTRDKQNAWPDGGYTRSKHAQVAPHQTLFHRYGEQPSFTASERVVRSHLRYLNDFEPFKKGIVTKTSLYEFLFYMIVEKGRRESYAKRVIKTIMAYLKAGGASAIINLSAESRDYVESFRGLGGVKMSIFYKRMDALANALNDDDTKRLLSTARCKRPLVFNDDEESRILRHCLGVIQACIDKYVLQTRRPSNRNAVGETLNENIEINTRTNVTNTKPHRVNYERTMFEFSLAYILGFLSGARIKSTVLRFSIDDVNTLLTGGRLEVLTKGVFVNVFLPAAVLKNESHLYGAIMPLRTRSLLYAEDCNRVGDATLSHSDNEACSQENECAKNNNQRTMDERSKRFFTQTARQLELMLDRVYKCLFGDKKRAKGVRWHSQRRRYLGTINSKYGAVTASDSVGHRDLATTLTYINNSLHMEDVRRKAGDAITERYKRIVS